MQYSSSLTKKQKFFITKCLRDLAELKEFYGRENGFLDISHVEDNYGQATLQTCLMRGWIKQRSHSCKVKTSHDTVCWVTQQGQRALNSKQLFS